VLDLMQPLAAGRQLISLAWEARRDEPGREGTHRKYCGAWVREGRG
jgi:hypothetical protein